MTIEYVNPKPLVVEVGDLVEFRYSVGYLHNPEWRTSFAIVTALHLGVPFVDFDGTPTGETGPTSYSALLANEDGTPASLMKGDVEIHECVFVHTDVIRVVRTKAAS